MVDEILKQEKLATTIDLNTDEQHATKMRKKTGKLQSIWFLSLFIGKKYFSNDGS